MTHTNEQKTVATIIAMGGGGFSMEPENPLLDDYVLELTGAERPRVCFMPTASGDAEGYVARFYEAFPAERAEASHLALFRRALDDAALRAHLLAQDILYIGGGNTANMLAVWRVHGVDALLREALARGVVLAGLSAGMICWFEAGHTDSFGDVAPLHDGLGFLAGSACPHYDGEATRRPDFCRQVASGALPPGVAADDGVALRFVDGALVESVSSRPGAGAWRVRPDGVGGVVEEAIATRYLGA